MRTISPWCSILSRFGWAVPCAVVIVASGCHRESSVTRLQATASAATTHTQDSAASGEELNPRLLRRFAAIPPSAAGPDSALVRLGRMLYFEPLLSGNGTISCNTCHPLERYGTTAERFATGVNGVLEKRNTPTVYNAVGRFRQFWDGRAANLDEQAHEPLINPAEMGMTAARIAQVLKDVPGYGELFARAFPGQAQPMTEENVAIALAEFERGLVTPGRWDRYLDGDHSALSAAEKDGARLFANMGCMVCHNGTYVGGTRYEKLGVALAWPNQSDPGRSAITNNPADTMVFVVPSLRNVARTAPYFHDASAATLEVAVRLMARHQLGIELTDAETAAIVAWLGALTGDIPRKYIAVPELPRAKRP